jgi:endonuclease-8
MEGPSLVILKEEALIFAGKEVIAASGALKWNKDVLVGQRIRDLKTWGKHFLILLDDYTIRIHYLMFGNYYINSRHPEKIPKLTLEFANGEWNNYNCAAKILDEKDVDKLYDWSSDVMQDSWSPAKAKKKLEAQPGMLVCDALMDQTIFSGVGNIIKNEVLYRIRLHPESQVGALPATVLNDLVREARNYCFDFFDWKKAGALRQHWLAHTKKICTRCNGPLTKQHTGLNPRRSFFCTACQVLYKMGN